MFGALLTLTSLQIEGMPIINSTQQSEPTKPAQQGTPSEVQYAVVADKDKKNDKEMDIEVCKCLYTYKRMYISSM